MTDTEQGATLVSASGLVSASVNADNGFDIQTLAPTVFIGHKREDFTARWNTTIHLRMIVTRVSESDEAEFLSLWVPANARRNIAACNNLPTIALDEASDLTVLQNISGFLKQRLGLVVARVYDWRTEIVPKAGGGHRLVLSYLVTVSNPTHEPPISDRQIRKVLWIGKDHIQESENGVQTAKAYAELFRKAENGDGDNNRLYILMEHLKMTRQSVTAPGDA